MNFIKHIQLKNLWIPVMFVIYIYIYNSYKANKQFEFNYNLLLNTKFTDKNELLYYIKYCFCEKPKQA